MHFMCRSQVLQVGELEPGCKNLTDMMVHLLSAIVCLHHILILLLKFCTREDMLPNPLTYCKVCCYCLLLAEYVVEL